MNDFISTIKTIYKVIFPQISFRFATNLRYFVLLRFAILTDRIDDDGVTLAVLVCAFVDLIAYIVLVPE